MHQTKTQPVLPAILDRTLNHLPVAHRQRLTTASLWPEFIRLQAAARAQQISTAQLDQANSAGSGESVIAQCERTEAEAIATAATLRDGLLNARVHQPQDIALKLLAVIASGQPGPASADDFPWADLNKLLRELAVL